MGTKSLNRFAGQTGLSWAKSVFFPNSPHETMTFITEHFRTPAAFGGLEFLPREKAFPALGEEELVP
jgi:hypothetical protein